jgi:CelD/BcsL family acetyltransferase involved in cellulose biosynthesis
MKDKQPYQVGWLLPEDASDVALLEARVHADEHRAGQENIRALFESTECGGRNLSLGVYHRDPAAPAGRRLVGFLLAFVMRTRREMGEFFDAPVPTELDPEESTLYLADWVFEPAHRGSAILPAEKLAGIVRAHERLRNLPVDAFSTPENASKWRTLQRWIARQGVSLAGSYPYHDAKLGRPMFWMHFRRVPDTAAPPLASEPQHAALTCRVVTDLWEWAELKLVWDRLLEASPERTPWQGYAFLTQWWRHLSYGMPLRIFVVERAGQPCLVLPMQIGKWGAIPGAPVRMLEPIGTIMDVNRPRLALGEFDTAAYRCALDFIWSRDDWDVIRIDEKPWDDPEIALLRDYGLEQRCLFRQVFSHLVPFLDVRQSWATFLSSRSQKLRKNLKAARRKLEARGGVVLRSYESESEVLKAFEVVLELHERSWKHKLQVEHSRSEGYPEFYSNWVEHMAQLGQCRILVLYCGESPVAATVAFTDRGTYYSAQIVHDADFAACSPGTLLEAMELELLMTEGRYHTYDMLGSFLNNKLRWTDTAMNSAHALVLRRRLRTFLMDAYFFLIKPYLRPALVAVYRRFRPKPP